MATVSDPAKAEPDYSHDELKAVLTTFETSLLTPTVSGELAPWLEEVQKSWKEASTQIHFHVKHLHPRQYDEISKQDPELLPQHRATASRRRGHRATTGTACSIDRTHGAARSQNGTRRRKSA